MPGDACRETFAILGVDFVTLDEERCEASVTVVPSAAALGVAWADPRSARSRFSPRTSSSSVTFRSLGYHASLAESDAGREPSDCEPRPSWWAGFGRADTRHVADDLCGW